MIWKTSICLIICIANTVSASACTLFAATGAPWVKGGGTLIVKNRDWQPQWQEMRLIEDSPYRYYGIFAGDMKKRSLRGGINEKGLVVFSASASSIPKKERNQMLHAKQSLLKVMLGECSNVDEALSHRELFLGPKFILLADADKIASIEIADNGNYKINIQKNNILAHTNHYLDPDLQQSNITIGKSSLTRYSRIKELLQTGKTPYTLSDFIAFSQDRHDGPDNSIWRTGSTPRAIQTLATFAVYIPKNKKPELYVKIRTAPDEQGRETSYTITGNELFPQKQTDSPDTILMKIIHSITQWIFQIFR